MIFVKDKEEKKDKKKKRKVQKAEKITSFERKGKGEKQEVKRVEGRQSQKGIRERLVKKKASSMISMIIKQNRSWKDRQDK